MSGEGDAVGVDDTLVAAVQQGADVRTVGDLIDKFGSEAAVFGGLKLRSPETQTVKTHDRLNAPRQARPGLHDTAHG